jgi:GrpB-like predicted nucleotidyltransferase (UPF0157 family)
MLMPDPLKTKRQPTSKEQLDAVTIGGARPHGGSVHLAEYDGQWPERFAQEKARIERTLGVDAIRIEHVGSTSVPGLAAKPIIDIVMEVLNSADEPSYVPRLEAAGYELRIREPEWYQHRVFKGPGTDINLHVFTTGCPEFGRMLRFRDYLRRHESDRKRYEAVKQELAAREWAYIQNYADAKTEIIEEINVRASPISVARD